MMSYAISQRNRRRKTNRIVYKYINETYPNRNVSINILKKDKGFNKICNIVNNKNETRDNKNETSDNKKSKKWYFWYFC